MIARSYRGRCPGHPCKALIDVRTSPSSRHDSQFDADPLSAPFASADIEHVHVQGRQPVLYERGSPERRQAEICRSAAMPTT